MSWASDMSGAMPPIHTHRPCGVSADVAYSPALAAALATVAVLVLAAQVAISRASLTTRLRDADKVLRTDEKL